MVFTEYVVAEAVSEGKSRTRWNLRNRVIIELTRYLASSIKLLLLTSFLSTALRNCSRTTNVSTAYPWFRSVYRVRFAYSSRFAFSVRMIIRKRKDGATILQNGEKRSSFEQHGIHERTSTEVIRIPGEYNSNTIRILCVSTVYANFTVFEFYRPTRFWVLMWINVKRCRYVKRCVCIRLYGIVFLYIYMQADL